MREITCLIIVCMVLFAAFYMIYKKNKDIRCREYILEKFAESVKAVFFLYNMTDGKIEYTLKENEQYLGISGRKLKQDFQSFYDLFPEKDAAQIREILKDENLTEKKEYFCRCSNFKTGEQMDVVFSAAPVEMKKQKKCCIIRMSQIPKEKQKKREESERAGGTPAKKIHKPIRYDLSGKKFLVVEDNGISIKIIKKMLEGSGALVEVAKTGEEAVNQFNRKEAGYYQVVMMDIELPDTDGFDTTARIRGLDKADAKTVPIFALTAGAIEENAEKAVQSGMSFYLEKPLDIELLCKSLERI